MQRKCSTNLDIRKPHIILMEIPDIFCILIANIECNGDSNKEISPADDFPEDSISILCNLF